MHSKLIGTKRYIFWWFFVVVGLHENKLSGIKLKYDKPCKFDLFKHSGHQTSRLCYERRFVLVLLSTVTYRKMFRYMYLFQSFARSFYSTFSHVNRGHVSRVLCIFMWFIFPRKSAYSSYHIQLCINIDGVTKIPATMLMKHLFYQWILNYMLCDKYFIILV